jgi:hypothetical protein
MSKASNSILIHNIAAKYILEDKNLNVDISGNEEKTEVLKELLEASRTAYNLVKSKNYNEKMLSEVLDKKRDLTERFKSLTGIDWRL